MHWYAVRYWKNRGVRIFDWGGEGEYKQKYGCRKVVVPRFCQSKYPIVSSMRDRAKAMFHLKQRVKGWLVVRPSVAA
jgi:hypothetical protein